MALAAAQPHLAESRHIGVVTGLAGKSGEFGKLSGYSLIAPAQIRCVGYAAVCGHRSRYVHADACDIVFIQLLLFYLV